MSGWEGEWVMEFPVLPPEINSVLMYSGAGSSPLLAAAAAWDGLAEELGSAAVSFGQVTSGLTAGVWQGAAAAAMAAAAAPYAGWLGSVAAAAEAIKTAATGWAAFWDGHLDLDALAVDVTDHLSDLTDDRCARW
nr:PPE family protein [Mycobacterium tuberculosis]